MTCRVAIIGLGMVAKLHVQRDARRPEGSAESAAQENRSGLRLCIFKERGEKAAAETMHIKL